ncbi:MAG: hypothetical protein F4082_02950 [Gammaproteobacteria bacterium]|nr:hypothetical protein [Gammaproteobacteria bacterium]
MKTTLYLDPELMRAAKKQALKDGISLTKLVEFSVRDYLDAANTPNEPFQLNLLTKKCGPDIDVKLSDRKKFYKLMEDGN